MSYVTMQEKLQGEYKDAFGRIEMYSIIEYIDETHREDLMMDLLDLLLSAQAEGKPVEKVLGSDIKQFCESYFGDYSVKGKLFNLLASIYRLAWIGLIMEFVWMLTDADGHKNPFMMTSDLTGYFTGFGGAIIFSAIFLVLGKPLIFKKHKIPAALFYGMDIVGSLALSFGLLWWVNDNSVPMPYWLSMSLFGGYILVFIIMRSISRYREYGSIRKRKEPGHQSLWKEINQQVNDELPMELEKRFQKINRKRERKGKPLMTEQEYLEKIRKESDGSARYGYPICIVLLSLILLYTIVHNYIDTGDLVDTLIYTIVLMVCEIPAFAIFSAGRSGDVRKLEIVNHCNEHGITLSDYVKELSQEASEEDPDA